jgi:3-phenylpropionate/cinnamic acid dioxygenase small subunit
MTAMTGAALVSLRDAAQSFVFREARILDDRRYDDWLALWAQDRDVLYWIPADDDHAGTEVISFAYDNGRRVHTRVRQLQTGERHAQVPYSRTVRVISNVEAEPTDAGVILVHAAFTLHEHRMDHTHVWAGRLEYELTDLTGDGELLMIGKKVLLVDRTSAVPSMAFIL